MLEARLAGTKPPAERGATIAVRELLQRRVPSLPKKEKIAVRHLNFYYRNGNQALKDISMPIYAQSVTALFGPSGCGKSTLIRVFNRIYALYNGQRTEGEVLLDGENILAEQQDAALLRARIGMVFQTPTPFPMSIYQNVAFGIGLYRTLPQGGLDAEVERALRRAALWDEVKDHLAQDSLSLSGVSSSGYASHAPSPFSPTCFCSTSLARRSIPFHRRKSRKPSMS